MPLSGQKVLSPLAVRFSQGSIAKTFRDGRDLESSLKSIRTLPDTGEYDVILVAPFPPIIITQDTIDAGSDTERSAWFSLDNRRLYCLQRAALGLWPCRVGAIVRILSEESLSSWRWKFDTSSNGRSLSIRGAEGMHMQSQWNWGSSLHPRIEDLETALTHALPLAAVARDEQKLRPCDVQDALPAQLFSVPAPSCDPAEDSVLQTNDAIRACLELLHKFWSTGWAAHSAVRPGQSTAPYAEYELMLAPFSSPHSHGNEDPADGADGFRFDQKVIGEVLSLEGTLNRGLAWYHGFQPAAISDTRPFLAWDLASDMVDDIDGQKLLETEEQFLDVLSGRTTLNRQDIAMTEAREIGQESNLEHSIKVLVKRMRKRVCRAQAQLGQGLCRRALLSLAVCSAGCSRLCRHCLQYLQPLVDMGYDSNGRPVGQPAGDDAFLCNRVLWMCCKSLQWAIPPVLGRWSPVTVTLRTSSLLTAVAIKKMLPPTTPLPAKKLVWDYVTRHDKVTVVGDASLFTILLGTGQSCPVQFLDELSLYLIKCFLRGPHVSDGVLRGIDFEREISSEGVRLFGLAGAADTLEVPGNIRWCTKDGVATPLVASEPYQPNPPGNKALLLERKGNSLSCVGLNAACLSRDHAWVALCTDARVRIYDTTSGDELGILWKSDLHANLWAGWIDGRPPHWPMGIRSVNMIAHTEGLVLGCNDGVIILEDHRMGSGARFRELDGLENIYESESIAAFAYDAGRLAVAVAKWEPDSKPRTCMAGVVVYRVESGQGVVKDFPVNRVQGCFDNVALSGDLLITVTSYDAPVPNLIQIWPSEMRAACLFQVRCSGMVQGIFVQPPGERTLKDWLRILSGIPVADRLLPSGY